MTRAQPRSDQPHPILPRQRLAAGLDRGIPEIGIEHLSEPGGTPSTELRKPTAFVMRHHEENSPKLDRLTDLVLAYHPKPKSKALKKRARKRQRDAKTHRKRPTNPGLRGVRRSSGRG